MIDSIHSTVLLLVVVLLLLVVVVLLVLLVLLLVLLDHLLVLVLGLLVVVLLLALLVLLVLLVLLLLVVVLVFVCHHTLGYSARCSPPWLRSPACLRSPRHATVAATKTQTAAQTAACGRHSGHPFSLRSGKFPHFCDSLFSVTQRQVSVPR